MRLAWGVVVLLAALFLGGPAAAPAQAQANATATAGGQVVQIGFNGAFQPTAWVPMKVSINPPGGETGVYLLRVHQQDLDGDSVVYQRSITLTGGQTGQQFWTYFKPQPVDVMPALDAAGVRERLRVVLCDDQGRELAQLAVPGSINPLYSGDDLRGGTGGRGKRLIVLVGDPSGGSFPGDREDIDGRAFGLTEQTVAQGVTTDALPDRAIGYAGVDAVIWQDADPTVLLEGGGERMAALRQWVRSGGKLVVMGRSQWETLEPIVDLLPVTPTGAVERRDLAPFLRIVRDNQGYGNLALDAWAQATGPFRYIVSAPKPDAVVETTFEYDRPQETGGSLAGEAPLIARRGEGFGSVTWVALDLSNRNVSPPLRGPNEMGWSILRAQILGLGERPMIDAEERRQRDFPDAERGTLKDVGNALLEGTRLTGRSVALVTVAMVFFIVYWLIAGPGLYFYLAAKGRTPASWFLFGATAVVATLVTLGVVSLILRGPPDLRHVSIVRMGPVAPQFIHCEMGLYIPEDGAQRLALDGGAPGVPPPTLTGYAIDPEHHAGGGGGRSNPISYVVNLDPPPAEELQGAQGQATVVEIPYRSTLKKLEASWHGPARPGIEGSPKLVPAAQGYVTGTLVNTTGQNLVNVHVAFLYDDAPGRRGDVYVLFLPLWRSGESIAGLNSIIRPENGPRVKGISPDATGTRGPPTPREGVFGRIGTSDSGEWAAYWYGYLRASLLTTGSPDYNDFPENGVRRAPAILSFFDLLPPMTNSQSAVLSNIPDATVLLRQGARELDVSGAVLAGRLVIVAEAEAVPLPVPLSVDGNAVKGTGRSIYQFILPLDRAAFERFKAEQDSPEEDPATQPAFPPDDAVVPPTDAGPP